MTDLKPCPYPKCGSQEPVMTKTWQEGRGDIKKHWCAQVTCLCGYGSPKIKYCFTEQEAIDEVVERHNSLPRTCWVSVDERLPSRSNFNMKYYVKYQDSYGNEWVGAAFYFSDNGTWSIDGDPDAVVTHWIDNVPELE